MGVPGSAEVKHVPMSEALRTYLVRHGTAPDPVTVSLAGRTAGLGDAAGMMMPVEQAALLTLLTRMLDARVVVDIGTFTGLSALALARGLGTGGRVLTCDVTDAYLDLAREHWQRAGVADRIDFRLGPAGRTLAALPPGTVVDLVLLDADKMNYANYFRAVVPLLRPGGLLLVDNVLLDGYVLDPELAGEPLLRSCARAMRAFNAMLAADGRLDSVMLPIADGLTVARRR